MEQPKGKPITRQEIKSLLDKTLNKFKAENSNTYDKYLKPGEMYLSTFNMSFDPKAMEEPSGDMLDYIYENGAKIVALCVGAVAIYVGIKLSVHTLGSLIEKLGAMIKSLTNIRYLGIFLMLVGLFIVGLRVYIGKGDIGSAKSYMIKLQDVNGMMTSASNEIINATRTGAFSFTALIKKIVFSALSFFDLSVTTVKNITRQASESRMTQTGLVLFGFGLVCFLVGGKTNG